MDGNSAMILDNILREYDRIVDLNNISEALLETAIGRKLDAYRFGLGFGLSKTDPLTNQQFDKDFVVSPGICVTDTTPVVFPYDKQIFAFNIFNDDNIKNIFNCYIFGSLYLTLNLHGDISVCFVAIHGSDGDGGELPKPIIMTRDIDEESIVDLFEHNKFYNNVISSPEIAESVKLYDIILSIDYFYNYKDYHMNIIYIDKRIIKGWAGYSEENMSINLTPTIANYKRTTQTGITAYKNQIKQLIQSWIGITGWDPDFVSYWTYRANMPYRLKQFINEEFNIYLP